MISTSYGVRFFARARRRSIVRQRSRNVAIWASTSSCAVVSFVNSYSEGKRKPSTLRRFRSRRNCGGGSVRAAAFV